MYVEIWTERITAATGYSATDIYSTGILTAMEPQIQQVFFILQNYTYLDNQKLIERKLVPTNHKEESPMEGDESEEKDENESKSGEEAEDASEALQVSESNKVVVFRDVLLEGFIVKYSRSDDTLTAMITSQLTTKSHNENDMQNGQDSK